MKDKDIEEILKLLGLKEGEDYAVGSKKQANYCHTVSDFPEVNNPSYVTTTATTDNYQYFGCDPQQKVQGFDFDRVVEERLAKIKHLMLVKSKEYVRDNNPFHNFDRGAEYTGETPEDYLYGLMTKHLVSIKDMVDDLYEGKDPSIKYLEEKIGDGINYLMLLEGLFKRRIL